MPIGMQFDCKVDFQLTARQRIHYSVLVCMSRTKIIGYFIKKGGINATDYTNFFKNHIDSTKRCHILMDNATIHHSKVFKEYILGTKNKPLYNAPGNPEGNPIEHLNNKVKQYIKYQDISTDTLIKKAIVEGFDTITRRDLQNFYSNSLATFQNEKE